MKLLILFGLFCLMLSPCRLNAENAPEWLGKENLGGIKIGQSEKELMAILGKAPLKKGDSVFVEATAEYVQNWTCPEKGLSLQMTSGAKKAGAKRVAGFTASSNSTLSTSQGIKIGSTLKEVRNAYGRFEDKETSKEDTFVAGSVYGGIIFTLKKGKVSQIFFGAAAE